MDGRQKSPLRHVKRAGIKVILVSESSALFDVRVLMVVVLVTTMRGYRSQNGVYCPCGLMKVVEIDHHEGCAKNMLAKSHYD